VNGTQAKLLIVLAVSWVLVLRAAWMPTGHLPDRYRVQELQPHEAAREWSTLSRPTFPKGLFRIVAEFSRMPDPGEVLELKVDDCVRSLEVVGAGRYEGHELPYCNYQHARSIPAERLPGLPGPTWKAQFVVENLGGPGSFQARWVGTGSGRLKWIGLALVLSAAWIGLLRALLVPAGRMPAQSR